MRRFKVLSYVCLALSKKNNKDMLYARYCFLLCLFCLAQLQAQVGIGTTTPNSALEIKTSSDDLPALELNPQTAPQGTVTGQISIIGDKLFMFDADRGKWLSVESTSFNFGLDSWTGDNYLEYAGDINDSGPAMPFAGTIVYATINTTDGDPNHTGSIQIFDEAGGATVVAQENFALVQGSRIYKNLNLDFEAGQIIRVYIDPTNWGVENPSLVLWIKWRN